MALKWEEKPQFWNKDTKMFYMYVNFLSKATDVFVKIPRYFFISWVVIPKHSVQQLPVRPFCQILDPFVAQGFNITQLWVKKQQREIQDLVWWTYKEIIIQIHKAEQPGTMPLRGERSHLEHVMSLILLLV